jgi:anti-sigma factor ChrR (cupin superfamily)
MDHPSEETLKRFAAGTASREESRAVVAHLLKSCASCASRINRLMEPTPVAGGSYEAALDRFDQGMIEALAESAEPLEAPDAPQGIPPWDLRRPRRPD